MVSNTKLGAFAYALEEGTVGEFFGAQFNWVAPVHEMRFDAGGIRYRLWLDEQRSFLFLTGDVRDPDYPLPAIEIGCECECIEETEASGIGPVMLFYASKEERREHLRICITRDREHRFSISPHWHQDEKRT